MFLFTCILIREQIFCAEGNREELERQFNKTFPNLNYDKKICYNIKPLYVFTQGLIETTKKKNEQSIMNLFNGLGVDNNNFIVSIDFNTLKKTVNEINTKIGYHLKNSLEPKNNVFQREPELFKAHLALDSLPQYNENKENSMYKKVDVFYSKISNYELSIKTKEGDEWPNIDNQIKWLFTDWIRAHYTAFKRALKEKKINKQIKNRI
ncbi:hypothetical protein CDIK_2430 [Cucumispora dikerogammari]|nr:hypothetical protein CDIK_2430 [Cucumispora dikerogammari]